MIDPTQAAAPAGQEQAAQGITVCITANPDGSFVVYRKDVAEQDAEPTDLETALDQAAQLLHDAAATQPAAQENAAADELFATSFDKTRGQLNRS